MARAYVHLVAWEKGRRVLTLCGMEGINLHTTNRYQGSTCGKCRRIASKEGK